MVRLLSTFTELPAWLRQSAWLWTGIGPPRLGAPGMYLGGVDVEVVALRAEHRVVEHAGVEVEGDPAHGRMRADIQACKRCDRKEKTVASVQGGVCAPAHASTNKPA